MPSRQDLRLWTAFAVLVAVTAVTAQSGMLSASAGHDMAGKGNPGAPGGGKVRRYYIAADPVRWNYAPSGRNLVTGKPFGETENVFVENGPDRIGSTYLKSLFREYTDATFTALKPRPAEWEHLGDLGPVIHAEVGDSIEVVFKNQTPFPASIHPHGVFYDKDSEGAPYADGTGALSKVDDRVAPGSTVTYHWDVPERAGPGPADGTRSCGCTTPTSTRPPTPMPV